MKGLMIIFPVLFLIVSCATTPQPSSEQLRSADYGPFPENWKQIVSNTMADEMVRPETLYIRKIEPPIKAWIITPEGEFICGWGVCGFVVMGLSTLEPFLILFHYDKPIYKVLKFNIFRRIPGQTWFIKGIAGDIYDRCCPNLFKY